MIFSSLEFLFFFFPIVIGINYLLPRPARNYWLLASSLFFYAWGEPTFFILLIISILVNYSLGLFLSHLTHYTESASQNEQSNDTSKSFKFLFLQIKTETIRKIIFILLLLLNLSALFITKYMNNITRSIRESVPAWQGIISATSFVLPLAISFYTFQSISYIFDIYRGMPAEKNICNYALYITFFPQLIQGPIIRYGDFQPQLEDRKITLQGFTDGIIRFLTGVNQKVLIANILSEVTDAAFGAESLSVGFAWLGMLAYSLQLYFDFAGYSDMAIGLGMIFGFRFKENFDFPYASKNITEFWRRWHISLGSWFRDYLYFPLGGSRVKSKLRIIFNLLVIWLATGIWHGADRTFIYWGLLHGLFIVMEKLTGLPKKIEKKPILQFLYHIVVLVTAMYGWMLFRAADYAQARSYTKYLLKLRGNPWRDSLFKFNSREYFVTLVIAIIGAFPLIKNIRKKISSHGEKTASLVRFVWFIIQMILAVISVSSLVMSSHNPFLYTNF